MCETISESSTGATTYVNTEKIYTLLFVSNALFGPGSDKYPPTHRHTHIHTHTPITPTNTHTHTHTYSHTTHITHTNTPTQDTPTYMKTHCVLVYVIVYVGTDND